MWALDPDDAGRILWSVRARRGGPLGGARWKPATEGRIVYAAVSDLADRAVAPCLRRLPECRPAQSAAVTPTPEYVLSSSVDGHLRAYATKDGTVLWNFDTVRRSIQ